MAEKAFGDAPYSFVKTSFPKDSISQIMKASVDGGIEAIVIPETHLHLLSRPEIIDSQLL